MNTIVSIIIGLFIIGMIIMVIKALLRTRRSKLPPDPDPVPVSAYSPVPRIDPPTAVKVHESKQWPRRTEYDEQKYHTKKK